MEVKTNQVKSRGAIYIKDNIKYTRETELNGKNSYLIVKDVEQELKLRIIIYRSFNPKMTLPVTDLF